MELSTALDWLWAWISSFFSKDLQLHATTVMFVILWIVLVLLVFWGWWAAFSKKVQDPKVDHTTSFD